jgi:outer membrane protein TolC
MKIIKRVLIILFFSTLKPVYALDIDLNLSIQDCVELAIKNNLDLKIESFNPEIKKLDLKKIYDEFGLSIGMKPNLQNNIRPTSNSFISGGTVLKEFTQNYDFFLKQKLITNGEISLDFQNNIFNTSSTRAEINPANIPKLGISFQQPLLRNAFIGYKRINIGENESLSSNYKLKSKVIDLILNTQNAYWDLVLNYEKLEVLKESLNLAEELYKINQEKEKQGVISKIDVLTAKANIASMEEMFIQGKRSIEESQDKLKNLINNNSDLEWSKKIKTNEKLEIDYDNFQFEEVYNTALNNRPDYKVALIDEKILEIQSEIAKQNMLPNLTVNGGVGLNSLDKDYLKSTQKMFSFETYFWNLGLNLEVPIIGNTLETEYQQTLINYEKQKTITSNIKRNILTELRTSLRNIDTNKQRITSNDTYKKLLSEQVKAELEKLKLGLSTNFQVMQLQKDLKEASLIEINSKIDYIKSINSLIKAQGLSLEKNKIIWNDNQ